MVTPDQLRAVMPNAGDNADTFAPFLNAAAARFGISTPKRVAAWLSQVAVETRELNALVESFDYKDPARLLLIFKHDFRDLADAVSVHHRGQEAIANRVYANQNGNGDEASGDGWRFRGRSCIQTTGRANYVAVMMGLEIDCVEQPELLEEPEHAANAAGLFWQSRNLNGPADRGDIIAVRKGVNGGLNGINEAIEYYRRALPVLCN